MEIGTGSKPACPNNNSGYALRPGSVGVGVGDTLPITDGDTLSEDVRPRFSHPVGILSAPAPARGAGWRNGGAADHDKTDIIGWSETSLYPVSVTSNHLLNIPGVLLDCGLEDRVFERKIICSKDPNHFSYTKSGNSCGDPGCPRHWKTWARQGADRIGFRVDGFRKASRTRYPARKIILSIDDEDPILKTWRARQGDIGAVKKARVYFIKKAAAVGCKGGSMVIHLWRTNDNVPGYLEGVKKWDFVRSQGSRWQNYVKFSPHAHIIGYGYLKPQSRDQENFEYKNMGPLNTREEIESVAYYNLSHAPVGKGITAVIYFGCCSYGKLHCVFKTKVHNDDFCPECGAVLIFEDSGEVAQRSMTWGDFKLDPGG